MGFLKFLIAGIILGLPFGPVGILCMSTTIEKGKKIGFISAMGAVSVDLIYGTIAFFMLIPAKTFIETNNTYLKIGVGIFLIIIGLTKIFGKVAVEDLNKKEGDNSLTSKEIKPLQEYIKIFLISIPNVFNILTIITIFTGLEIFALKESFLVAKLILGIFVGSSLFWFFTTTLLNALRDKITPRTISMIVKLCGLAILVFGVLLEVQVFQG